MSDAPKFASMSECRRIATMNPGLMAEKFRELRLAYDALKKERDELVRALEFIAGGCLVPPDGGTVYFEQDAIRAAKDALEAVVSKSGSDT